MCVRMWICVCVCMCMQGCVRMWVSVCMHGSVEFSSAHALTTTCALPGGAVVHRCEMAGAPCVGLGLPATWPGKGRLHNHGALELPGVPAGGLRPRAVSHQGPLLSKQIRQLMFAKLSRGVRCCAN